MKKTKWFKLIVILTMCFALAFSVNPKSDANSTYKLNNSVRVYMDASSAQKRVNAKTTYNAGTYYVFRSYNGMLNISKTQGKAGGWINPADNKVVQQQNTVTKTSNSKNYVLNTSVKGFATAADAQKNINAKTTYSSGTYYIYKSFNGMLNISKQVGKAGVWINPSHNAKPVVQSPAPKPVTTPSTNPSTTSSLEKYILVTDVKVYSSAQDAMNSKNSKSVYKAGNYYLYKNYNGMINISSVSGKAGGWINPNDNVQPKPITVDLPKFDENTPEFIKKIAPVAMEISKGRDIYTSIMIAQAILESGWGTTTLALEPNNNLFGVKGNYNGNSVEINTYEYNSVGQRYQIAASFKKYPSIKESLADYITTITGNDVVGSWRYNYYIGVRVSQTTSYKDATAYLTGRYATAPDYGTKLNSLIERYNLTQYDVNVK